MTSVLQQFEQIENDGSWLRHFQRIVQVASQYDYECTVSQKQVNIERNRYADVAPFDHCRVKLKSGENDYINASFLDMELRQYILSQGPLDGTACHFWQMVWEQNSKAVVMLNKVIEKGHIKCSKYWPGDEDHVMVFHSVDLKVTFLKDESSNCYVVRHLKLSKISDEADYRVVLQFHFTAWPDFGVPRCPDAFLDFLVTVQESGLLNSKTDCSVGPPVVHCSAGIGRTGTFVLVDICSQYLLKNGDVDVCEQLLEMRKFRMGLIQTPEQLRFSFSAICQYQDYYQDNCSSLSSIKPSAKIQSEAGEQHSANKRALQDELVVMDPKKPKVKIELPTKNKLKSKDNDSPPKKRTKKAEREEEMRKKIEEVREKMKKSENPPFEWKWYLVSGVVTSILVGIAVRYWLR